MGRQGSNTPWFVSTHTTAAGVALEFNGRGAPTTAQFHDTNFTLRGFYVSGSTAVAVSTTPIKLIYGDSSNSASTIELCNEPGAGMIGASDLMGLTGGYFALETTVAHADGGLTFAMWGD